MTQLDKLKRIIEECIDETNRWELPKGFYKVHRESGSRDVERGAWAAFNFVLQKINRIQSTSGKSKSGEGK